MRVAVISANLGDYDAESTWPDLEAPPGINITVHRFTDPNFPPRRKAMTAALQCGIPKMFGWELAPGADAYLWIDASCAPTARAVPWFLERLGSAELALFRHPDRRTIREEYAFITARLARPGERYLSSRYAGEWLEEQWRHIQSLAYTDDALYASTAFMYRPTARVVRMLKEWWFGKTRWLLHDQLYLPVAVAHAGCRVSVIEANYLRCPALTYVRNKGRRRVA